MADVSHIFVHALQQLNCQIATYQLLDLGAHVRPSAIQLNIPKREPILDEHHFALHIYLNRSKSNALINNNNNWVYLFIQGSLGRFVFVSMHGNNMRARWKLHGRKWSVHVRFYWHTIPYARSRLYHNHTFTSTSISGKQCHIGNNNEIGKRRENILLFSLVSFSSQFCGLKIRNDCNFVLGLLHWQRTNLQNLCAERWEQQSQMRKSKEANAKRNNTRTKSKKTQTQTENEKDEIV